MNQDVNPQRRSLFRSLLTLPLLGSVARTLGADRIDGTATGRNLLLNECHIAGFCYYEGVKLIEELRTGDRLTLRPEPHNPHDEFAVEVYRGQRKLGYLPRTENAHVSRLLRQGATVYAELADINTSLYFEEIAIRVWLEASGHPCTAGV
ncbi:MAG: HIRAN domain-containing protein [Acidobacteria bacterium]|nr:HIRAN domain-containing protein [Acidobacteriota bacterium]